MRICLIVALASLASATLAPLANAKTIAKGHASGDYAVTQAAGTVKRPGTIRVKVTASPRQKVSVSWTMVCTKGTNAGSKSGQFEARTNVNRALKKPMSHTDSCTVSANAQLSGSGKVSIAITA